MPELVGFFRVLKRHRLLVVLGALLAIAPAVLMLKSGKTTRVGIAQSRVVLDTTESEILSAKVVGADSLPWRASILAELLRDDQWLRHLSAQMGIRPQELTVVVPDLLAPEAVTPLSERALDAATSSPEPYIVGLQTTGTLPIVVISTSAPTAERAGALAKAAASTIRAAAKAPAGTPDVQPYIVQDFGPVRTRTVVNGPRRIVAPIMTVVLFAGWCFALVLVSGARRSWRGSVRRYQRTTAGESASAT